MPTRPEAPAAVLALANTEPSVDPPRLARPSAPAPAPEPEQPRRALTPLVLMLLSAVLVVVIGVLASR